MDPDHIGRYEILSEVGRGGMATVYRANDPRFKREVAIKVLPSQFLHDPTFRTRFEREAQMVAAIEHPSIVPVYDYGEENSQPYLVMRYMHGGSLSDILRKGPMSFREAARIITQLAPALDEMHSRGIIHRDLKPGNILFDHYGNAFIADFGIARLTQATTTLTGDAIIGTPSYMSPEQARGETDIDGRSDIYAMGAILFEMLTGKQPYQATTPMGIVMKHITEPVPRILEIRSDLPAGTEMVITRAMAKRREDRFPLAKDMAAAQEAIIREIAVRQTSPTTFEPPTTSPAKDKPAPVVKKPGPPVQDMPSPLVEKPGQRVEKVSPLPEKPVPAVEKPPQGVPLRPQPEKPPEGRPARPGAEAKPPAAADSGQLAQSFPARATPQAAQVSKPVSTPALRPVPVEKPRSRKVLWIAIGVAAVIGLCLLASALGIPRLLSALNPSATDPVAALSPAPVNTPTASNGVQVQSSPSPRQSVDVFIDDFSKTDSGWDRGEDDGNITDYEGGFYRIYIDKPNLFYWSNPGLEFSDVSIEVEATKSAGPDDNFFGLICRYQDPYNFYMLAISSDGYYSIRKYQNGQFSYLGADQWHFSQSIHQGKTANVLRADCIGDTLILYANGTKLGEAMDSTFQSGDVGMTAASLQMAGTNILFDNFVAKKP